MDIDTATSHRAGGGRLRLLLFPLLALMLLATACPPPPSPTPTPTTTPTTDPRAIMSQALQRFNAATSYGFETKLTHQWTFEGKVQIWDFTGRGAFIQPDRYRFNLEGPADSHFDVVITGTQVAAWDTRGPVPRATTTFGAPLAGASPFTVISYLKNYDSVSYAGTVSLPQGDAFRIGFAPSLARTAAIDAAHSEAMQGLSFRYGEVIVGRGDLLPRQLTTVVERRPATGDAQVVTTTLTFADYR